LNKVEFGSTHQSLRHLLLTSSSWFLKPIVEECVSPKQLFL
jgi:hypothetical protein